MVSDADENQTHPVANVVELDDYRPHVVGRATCRECNVSHISVHPAGANPHRLECHRCGACDSVFEQYVPEA